MKTLGCFLAFTLILAAVPAYADSDLTIFGAAQHQGKLNLQTATSTATTTSNLDPSTFGVFGVRYGHGKIIGGEHTLAFAPNFLVTSGRAIIYNSDLRLQVDAPKVKPYATAGLGAIFTWSKNTTPSSVTTTSGALAAIGDIGTKFAINYGGGVKIMPAGPVGVRFDIRGYTLPSVSFNVPGSIAGQTIKTTNQNVNFFEFGFGVVFKFGK
jgi:opacity protein-like surface antigen